MLLRAEETINNIYVCIDPCLAHSHFELCYGLWLGLCKVALIKLELIMKEVQKHYDSEQRNRLNSVKVRLYHIKPFLPFFSL